MLKKLISLLIITCLLSNTSYSQKLMHAFGTTISVLYGKITTPYSSSSFSLAQTNLTYFPRYNFVENENSSISIGFPVGIGIGIASNTYGNDAGISFAYDLPATIDYNIGFKSTSENEKKFGAYFGAGFGYYKVSISGSQYSDFKGATYGPLFRGGVRIGSSNESWNGHALTIGMFYKKGLEKDKLATIGFNVLYDL
jgi:hypothetical protein